VQVEPDPSEPTSPPQNYADALAVRSKKDAHSKKVSN
jgi:hypothetical protein